MNSKTKKTQQIKKFLIAGVILMLFSLVVSLNEENDTVVVNSKEISNKKIGWGIQRNNNHEQPNVGKENRKVLEKNNGICLGNKDKKYIYLTFDEGYEAGYTETMLEILKKHNVKATFFITAHYLNSQEELVRKMIDEGHIVGNHTVNHKSMPDLGAKEIEEELMKLHNAMKEKMNYEMKYMRPPKGEFSERTLIETNKNGYKTVMWSFAYEDWNEKKQMNLEKAKRKIIENIHNGEIMLLHGNSKTNLDILSEVIQKIKDEGYEFKSLEEFE